MAWDPLQAYSYETLSCSFNNRVPISCSCLKISFRAFQPFHRMYHILVGGREEFCSKSKRSLRPQSSFFLRNRAANVSFSLTEKVPIAFGAISRSRIVVQSVSSRPYDVLLLKAFFSGLYKSLEYKRFKATSASSSTKLVVAIWRLKFVCCSKKFRKFQTRRLLLLR